MNKLLAILLVFGLVLSGCLTPAKSTNNLNPDTIVNTTPEEIALRLASDQTTQILEPNYYFYKGHPLLGLNESRYFDVFQFKPIPIGQKTGPKVTIVRAKNIEDAESLFTELKMYYFDDCKWGLSACFKPLEQNRVNVGNEMGSVYRSAEWCSSSHNQGCGKNDAYVVFFRRNNVIVLLESYMAFNTGIFGDYPNTRDPEASEAQDKLGKYAVLIDEAIH